MGNAKIIGGIVSPVRTLGGGVLRITGGTVSIDNAFVAEYNVTTYADVLAAFNAGKLIFCYVSSTNALIPLSSYDSGLGQFRFDSIRATLADNYRVTSSGWSHGSLTLLTSTTGVTSFNNQTGDVTYDPDADDIDYDNTSSGLTADDVQEAIDEIVTDMAGLSTALSGKEDAVTEQTVATDGAVTQALLPNVIYHFTGTLTSLTLTLTAPVSGLAHYHFDFVSGSTAPTLSLPGTVTMPDDFQVEADNRYEVDILNNYGTAVSWATS